MKIDNDKYKALFLICLIIIFVIWVVIQTGVYMQVVQENNQLKTSLENCERVR